MTTATKGRRPAKGKTPGGITLAADALRRALATVKSAVGGFAKPILSNVYIGNGVAEATDLEMRISCELDYHETPILLPYHKLSAIIDPKYFRNDSVSFSIAESTCTISGGLSEWTIPTERPEDFPSANDQAHSRIATIPASLFARAVSAVSYACDTKSMRYALGSVLISVDRKTGLVSFVGTDGRRLSLFSLDIGNHEDPDSSETLVPCQALNVIAAIAKPSLGAVALSASKGELMAVIDKTTVRCRLAEGRFPPWRDVFPSREVARTAVNANELLAATRQAAIVTSEQSKGVAFAITADGIHLTARSSEAGESSVTCPHLEFGQAATVSLDPHFVCDFLRACDDGEPVEIEAVDAQSAVVLRSGDYHGVIMPLAAEG